MMKVEKVMVKREKVKVIIREIIMMQRVRRKRRKSSNDKRKEHKKSTKNGRKTFLVDLIVKKDQSVIWDEVVHLSIKKVHLT